MTLLDWALLVVWLGVTLSGFWKGAVRLVFGGGGLIVGLWLAVMVGGDTAATLEPVLGIDWIAAVLGRLLPLVGCVLVGLVAGWVVAWATGLYSVVGRPDLPAAQVRPQAAMAPAANEPSVRRCLQDVHPILLPSRPGKRA